MKIAITGHTKGIGKAIAGLYYTDEVVGFSRSNGYDITEPNDIARIITESANCNIFVNNAYHDFAQCDLLERMFELWKNDPTKTIVNIIISCLISFLILHFSTNLMLLFGLLLLKVIFYLTPM